MRLQRIDELGRPIGRPSDTVNDVTWFMEQFDEIIDQGRAHRDALVQKIIDGLDLPPVPLPAACPDVIIVDDLYRPPPPADVDPGWESMRDRPDLLAIHDDGVKPGSPAHNRRVKEWARAEDNQRAMTGRKGADSRAQQTARNESMPRLTDAQLDADRLIEEVGGFDLQVDMRRRAADGLIDEMLHLDDDEPDADDDVASWGGSHIIGGAPGGKSLQELTDRCKRLGFAFDELRQVADRVGWAVDEVLDALDNWRAQ
jgi:hypothetical protein